MVNIDTMYLRYYLVFLDFFYFPAWASDSGNDSMQYICTMRIYNMPFEPFLQLSKDEFFLRNGMFIVLEYCT